MITRASQPNLLYRVATLVAVTTVFLTVTASHVVAQKSKGNRPSVKKTENNPAGPKRPGVMRIGVATTSSQASAEQNEAVLAQIYESFYGNRLTSLTEVIFLKEKLDINIFSEAARTKCDRVLVIALDSEIRSAREKHGAKINLLMAAAVQGLGIVQQGVNPGSSIASFTDKSYRMAQSATVSQELLNVITDVTKKKDRISARYSYADVATGQFIIKDKIHEAIAKRDKEPLLSNFVITLGNTLQPLLQRKP